MERGSSSTSPDRSPLAAWLDPSTPGAGRAEALAVLPSLGRWLGWKDAIALSAVLHGPPPAAPARRGGAAPSVAALSQELAALRATLQQAIADALAGPAPARGRAAAAGPEPGGGAQDGTARRQACGALQRAMAESVAALRARARAAAAAAAHSPALARLAALDAVMEGVLSEREQQGLAGLCRRRLPDAGAAALQGLLQAELEHRLQPVLGLLEALAQPAHPTP